MKLCYNGKILEKPLPERMSKLFEKTKVLKTDAKKEYYKLNAIYDEKIIEAAIRFYEAPKPFSDDDLSLFTKYKNDLFSLSKSLKLPSLQNFTGFQIKPSSYKKVSTQIEDKIIVFGQQDFDNYYSYDKSRFPTFPTFKCNFKTKVNAHGEDKFMRLYQKYQSIEDQIKNLDEELQNSKKKFENQEELNENSETEEPKSEENDEKQSERIEKKKSQKKNSKKTPKKIEKKAPKKIEKAKETDDDDNDDDDDDKNSYSNKSEEEETDESNASNKLDLFVIKKFEKIQYKKSIVKNVTYGYSSSISKECEKVDILANTDGWFYQSEDKESQFVVFKFSSPVVIDYYFIMTYALPNGFAHLKKWRLGTLKKDENKKFVVLCLDQRETDELNGPNKMGGFEVNFDQPVDNVFIQITGPNAFDNLRLTLQNIFFSSNPPLDYESPFCSK